MSCNATDNRQVISLTPLSSSSSVCSAKQHDPLYHRVCIQRYIEHYYQEHKSNDTTTLSNKRDLLKCPNCKALIIDPSQPRTKLRESVHQFVQPIAAKYDISASTPSTSNISTPA